MNETRMPTGLTGGFLPPSPAYFGDPPDVRNHAAYQEDDRRTMMVGLEEQTKAAQKRNATKQAIATQLCAFLREHNQAAQLTFADLEEVLTHTIRCLQDEARQRVF